MKDLVKKYATAAGPNDQSVVDAASADPETWWKTTQGGAFNYSRLLEGLAPTPAARQALLRSYFEPTDEDREQGLKKPMQAHHAVANLGKEGYVRLVITTNFDRLMEQALEEVGVQAQVITNPSMVDGMNSLVHAPATVVKLHGDFLDLGIRNIESELEKYPEPWQVLLEQVFNDFGLVIAGWSAEWDKALVTSLQSARGRRYPLYWDQRSSKGQAANRLLALRSGSVVPSSNADELFTSLQQSIESLEKLSEPPITTAMAIGRLKKFLPDPQARIELHDLIQRYVRQTVENVENIGFALPEKTPEAFENSTEQIRAAVLPLLRLVATGIWHDDSGIHDKLWLEALDRLASLPTTSTTVPVNRPLGELHRFPALLLLATIGTAACNRGREDLLARAFTTGDVWMDAASLKLPFGAVLNPFYVLKDDAIRKMPRWGGAPPALVHSRMIKDSIEVIFSDLLTKPGAFNQSFADFDYRYALILAGGVLGNRGFIENYIGEFALSAGWTYQPEKLLVQERLEATQTTPWFGILGEYAKYQEVVKSVYDQARKVRDYHWEG